MSGSCIETMTCTLPGGCTCGEYGQKRKLFYNLDGDLVSCGEAVVYYGVAILSMWALDKLQGTVMRCFIKER